MRLHEKFGHVLTWTTLVNALPSISGHTKEPSCRFAHQYSQKQVLRDPTAFINDMLYWEGKFHQNNISYNSNNGISYDGTNIDWVTGEATTKHTFSAASKEALENTGNKSYRELAQKWQVWMDYTKTTAAKIFYKGNGRVCTVIDIKDQSLPVNHPDQSYLCETKDLLDDPFEGEIFTFWLQFFGGLSKADKQALWEIKRPQLVSVDYKMGGFGPITVQKGFWFSSHETWKVMEMPYYDIDIVRRLFKNAERVRTCNSVATKLPGMFASVNNITDPSIGDVTGYISNAGIPSISNQTVQELDVITPYSVFPTILVDKSVGLAWWRNMVIAKKMQNIYGSTESTRVDGTGVSALLTWDSKVTTVVAILGGVTDLVRQKMKADHVYDEFVDIIETEYSRVFKHLKGENVDLCLPHVAVPDSGLDDFTLCE
ncbi:CAZyme family GH162 [Penicillium roqueforti]|nr:CAZyme family GH162 [Penicillium roqueforti]